MEEEKCGQAISFQVCIKLALFPRHARGEHYFFVSTHLDYYIVFTFSSDHIVPQGNYTTATMAPLMCGRGLIRQANVYTYPN